MNHNFKKVFDYVLKYVQEFRYGEINMDWHYQQSFIEKVGLRCVIGDRDFELCPKMKEREVLI